MLLHILRVDYCEACHLTPAIVPQLVNDWICLFWGHIRHIIDNCKNDLDKALFFVGKTIENNWSGAALLNFLGTDLYERQGKAFTDYPPVRFRSNSAPIMQVRALFCQKIWWFQTFRLLLHSQTRHKGVSHTHMGKCCTASSLRILQGLTAAKVVGCSGAMQ